MSPTSMPNEAVIAGKAMFTIVSSDTSAPAAATIATDVQPRRSTALRSTPAIRPPRRASTDGRAARSTRATRAGGVPRRSHSSRGRRHEGDVERRRELAALVRRERAHEAAADAEHGIVVEVLAGGVEDVGD